MLERLDKKSILISTPFFNEEDGIFYFESILKKIHLHSKKYKNFSFRFLFIDDGSEDNTYLLLKRLKKNRKNISIEILKHKKNLGYGATLKSSISNCKEDFLITYDSDCAYDYKLIFKLIDKIIVKNCDIVNVSYKLINTSFDISFFRQFLSSLSSFLYILLFREISKNLITVLTCSFRIYNFNKIKNIKIISNDFNACSELLIRSLIKKLSILEIPGRIKKRKFGQSKMKIIKNSINHLKFIWKMKFT